MRTGTTVGSVPKASMSHDQPVLCSTWKDDGTTVFSGGCDKQVKMWPLLSGGQPVTVAMHDAPVKEIAWIPEMNLLVSGSWDKTLRYWDLRQSNPVHTQQLPERCYAFTVRHPLMVVGTADRNLIVFNLQNPQKFVVTKFGMVTFDLNDMKSSSQSYGIQDIGTNSRDRRRLSVVERGHDRHSEIVLFGAEIRWLVARLQQAEAAVDCGGYVVGAHSLSDLHSDGGWKLERSSFGARGLRSWLGVDATKSVLVVTRGAALYAVARDEEAGEGAELLVGDGEVGYDCPVGTTLEERISEGLTGVVGVETELHSQEVLASAVWAVVSMRESQVEGGMSSQVSEKWEDLVEDSDAGLGLVGDKEASSPSFFQPLAMLHDGTGGGGPFAGECFGGLEPSASKVSDWVLERIGKVSQLLGISFDGHEGEAMSLFSAIEMSWRSRVSSTDVVRSGAYRQKGERELRNLECSINYDRRVGEQGKKGRRGREKRLLGITRSSLLLYENLMLYHLSKSLQFGAKCFSKLVVPRSGQVGSIEGRVGVHHLDDSQQSKNFTFKCHREGNEIYSVNSLNFHPVRSYFATAIFLFKVADHYCCILLAVTCPRRCQGAANLYLAVLSTMMARYMLTRSQRLKANRELEPVAESETASC
ncbi:hypothetical protein TEA_009244 [Camellia sinensis var. sinensis]|uniref:Uncharacterized protein n=1 Tax=Camellia sinensis var. sinensis TaxID=542762 RepID=A0A4S4E620_CAMSN|nr:hypothetical protein TEA_009244 [Camellia sinensis var. sinensis]